MAAEDSVKALGTTRSLMCATLRSWRAAVALQLEQLRFRPQMIEAVKAAVETLNARMKDSSRSLEFSMDDVAKRSIRVIDKSSGDLIRQLPNEKFFEPCAILNFKCFEGA